MTSGGNILEEQETIENPIRYAGEYYDEESGLYYLRARYYDPVIGSFITKDSYEGQLANPLSLNLYTYCYNNPLVYVDPSGHEPYRNKHMPAIRKKLSEYTKGRVIEIKNQFSDTVFKTQPVFYNGETPYVLTSKEEAGIVFDLTLSYLAGKSLESVSKISSSTSGSETSKLYRVMGDGEYNSLMETGQFQPYERAMDSKGFATTAEDASKWAEVFYKNGNYKMVEVTVPTESLEKMYFMKKLDGIGSAYCAEREMINEVIKLIKEVTK